MQDKLIPLCKLLIFPNEEAKEGEPQWTVFLAEREQKPQPQADGIPNPGGPMPRRLKAVAKR